MQGPKLEGCQPQALLGAGQSHQRRPSSLLKSREGLGQSYPPGELGPGCPHWNSQFSLSYSMS